MSGVDNRIVTMQFNNRQFEQDAKTTLTTLERLKESMSFKNIGSAAARGLSAVSKALADVGKKTPFAPLVRGAETAFAGIGRVIEKLGIKNPFSSATQGASELQKAAMVAGGPAGMGVLEGGVTAVSNKFLALSTIAITALSNITNRAINAGTSFVKGFTFAPINDGLKEYELNLKSIQTIQANTDRPLPEITGALEELNKYSDLTIYNFGEMAKNIGTFTAAGVDLETSVSAIKGIANMAALSGSNSQQASTAMYQLSQALASGRVGLQDWNSVVNAGMGGKKLQNALAQTAIAMGDIDAAQVKGVKSGEQLTIMGNSFRESIMAKPGQESWLSSKVLENALASLDGRYSAAALSQAKLADGTLKYKNRAEVLTAIEKARNAAAKDGVKYTDEQFKALQKLSTSAFESATKVKTLGQVFEIAKETIASGWSASFKSIFGNLKEAKELFTGMSAGLNGILEANALARNNLLADWKDQGGRDTIIDGLKNAWEAMLAVGKAVKSAWRDVFPEMSAENLVTMSEAFEQFTDTLIPTPKTIEKISGVLRGFFSILSIGKTILLGVWEGVKALFGAVSDNSGSILDFGGSVAEVIVNFDEFLKKTGVVEAFFVGLGNILSIPIALLSGLASVLGSLFEGFSESDANGVGNAVDSIGDRFANLSSVGEKIRAFFDGLGDFFSGIGKRIGNAMAGIGEAMAGAITPESFMAAMEVIKTSLLAGIVVMLRNLFKGGIDADISGGFFDSIKETLGEATTAFQVMQTSLKADVLLRLGAAIGVMALSLLVLSSIDPAALRNALAALTTGLGALVAALIVLMKYMGPVGILRMYAVSTALITLTGAILLMAVALKLLAGIKFGDMMRGLVGLAAMLWIINKAMGPLVANSAGMNAATGGLIKLAVAITILSLALKIFASMSWEEIAKGLLGLAGTLAVLVVAMKLMPNLEGKTAGLLALSVAVTILSVALEVFASMNLGEIGKGLLTLAGSLLIIAGALRVMPKDMLKQSIALNAVAAALVVLSGALKVMGSMSPEQIAKALITLGGALTILVVGLTILARSGTKGAAALVVVAAALAVMVPVLVALGSLPLGTIITALGALAAVFVILGVAGVFLGPLLPIIAGLAGVLVLVGVAALLAGAGIALIGVGILATATALGILATVGIAAIQTLMLALSAIISKIPEFLIAVGQGVVGMVTAIGNGAPQIAAAFGKILNNLLDQAIEAVPKIGKLFLTLINTALNVISVAIPRFINTGLKLITSFLSAIAKNLPRIITLAATIIVNFVNGIARNLPRIIQAGVNLILSFIRGLTQAINNNSEAMGRAGAELGVAIVRGMASGITGGASVIKDAALRAAKDAFQAVKDFFGIKSPSRLMHEEVGLQIPAGVAGGIDANTGTVVSSIDAMGKTAVSKLQDTMSRVEGAFGLSADINPTVTPVLDLAALTKEANKMSSILAVAPIMPTVSYEAAVDISTATKTDDEPGNGPENGSGGGDTNITYEQHLHSPTPLDSAKIYRDGKSLLALKKEELV